MNHPLPGTNYTKLKTLIIAYSRFQGETVTSSKLSEDFSGKIPSAEIARNSDFFYKIGLLKAAEKRGQYYVSDICKRLGAALSKGDNDKDVAEIWTEIIWGSPFFKTLIHRIDIAEQTTGSITKKELKNSIISLSKFKDKGSKNPHIMSDYSLSVIQILEAAKAIRFVDSNTIKLNRQHLHNNFISLELIQEFRKIKLRRFNLERLTHYCLQINFNYSQGYFEAVAFVTRALMDHVPPIFNQPNFESIGSQVKQGKITSFKKSCDKLNNSLKHIADDLIHKQISAGVSMLVKEEIDFSQDLNTFLRRTLEELKTIQSLEK